MKQLSKDQVIKRIKGDELKPVASDAQAKTRVERQTTRFASRTE